MHFQLKFWLCILGFISGDDGLVILDKHEMMQLAVIRAGTACNLFIAPDFLAELAVSLIFRQYGLQFSQLLFCINIVLIGGTAARQSNLFHHML